MILGMKMNLCICALVCVCENVHDIKPDILMTFKCTIQWFHIVVQVNSFRYNTKRMILERKTLKVGFY